MKRIKGAPYVLRGYTEQQRDQLLRLISEGVTKTAACLALAIPTTTVSVWVREDEEFAAKWKRARMEQAHALGDEMLEIADAACGSMEAVQHARLRVETRKWLMSKWAPQHYGEKLRTDHNHTVGVVLLPALDFSQKTLNDISKALPGADAE